MSQAEAPIRPERGAEVELTVDTLAHGGNGVARIEGGYVVFVSGAVPGDRVRALITKRKRAYAEARTLELLEPSPDRIAAVAEHPGAPWQVLPYERQLEIKAEQLEDALRRIGKLDGFAIEPIVAAEQQWRYRNKVEFSFGAGTGSDPTARSAAFTPPEAGRTSSRSTTACLSQSRSTMPAAPSLISAASKGWSRGTGARMRASCAIW